MRKAVIVLGSITLIFLFLLNIITFSTKADLWTTVSIEAESQVEIDVSPGSSGLKIFPINVTCDTIFNEDVIVELTANSTIGRISIWPRWLTFKDGGNQTIKGNVSIRLPRHISSYEVPKAILNGTWRVGPDIGEVEPFNIQIIVLPYSNLYVFCSFSFGHITQGESTSFDFFLNNTGNMNDLYRIEITNKDELKNKGITISVPKEIYLAEGDSDEIEVKVRTSFDTPLNQFHRIDIVFTSVISEDPYQYNYSIAIRLKPGIIWYLTHPISIIIIAVVLIIIGIILFVRRRK